MITARCISAKSEKLERLNQLLSITWARNGFYRRKWTQAGIHCHRLEALSDLERFPITARAELVHDQSIHPPFGTNLSAPLEHYHFIFRSSGTTLSPLVWADTAETWHWITHGSEELYKTARVQWGERILFLIPFAASPGPWIMHRGATQLGCTCLVAGRDDAREQWRWLQQFEPTVLVGTPEQIIRLGCSPARPHSDPCLSPIQKIISAGRPGGSVSSLRVQMQNLFGAEVFDRYGMTEAGSVAAECPAHAGMHVLEDEFIAECLKPDEDKPVEEGETGEIVLTNLGRTARPIIRYRTGDFAQLSRDYKCSCGRRGSVIVGGITRNLSREKFCAAEYNSSGNGSRRVN